MRKRKALALTLALVMCLGLAIPSFAVGETTVQDEMGLEYILSSPVLGTETYEADAMLGLFTKQDSAQSIRFPRGPLSSL